LAERERFVSLGRLSSSLAHEINNPLGGLLNATDTLRTYPDRPDVVRDASDILDRGLNHLRDVSQAILDENRRDRSERSLGRADFDDLKLLFEPETKRLSQTLEWQVDGTEAEIAAWPSAPVRQIALNLLLNASAAAGQGGNVGLVVGIDGDTFSLTVTDDGPGLSQQAEDRLLSTTPLEPGGGVGLRLVRDLVAELGGEIAVARANTETRISVQCTAREADA
jgi:signal transduction histidine kinase